MSRLPLRLLDRSFVVEVSDAHVERLRAQWSRCLDTTGRPATSAVDHAPGADTPVDSSDYWLVSRLTVSAIEARAGELLMLHAAGVCDRDTGRTAVLAAGSGTGKTTAARSLCVNEFGYVTDETVAFDADGTITPYPKPLSVVIDGGPGAKSQHGPDELGLQRPPDICQVGFIAVLERSDEPFAAAVEPMPLLDGLVALIPQTSALPRFPQPLRALAQLAERTGGVRLLRYSEAADLIPLVRGELNAASAACDPFEHLPPSGDGERADPTGPLDPVDPPEGWQQRDLQRAPYTDAIGTDGDRLVLAGTSPIRLQGVAASVWRALDIPRDLPGTVTACVAEHGDHPDAAALVEEAAEQLLRAGVIQTTADS